MAEHETHFLSGFNLAQVFTPPNQQGKYLTTDTATEEDRKEFSGCMKPIEFFLNDITKNLKEWTAINQRVILYRTNRFWYWFELKTEQGCPIVWMTRFDNSSWQRWDSWVNLSSIQDDLGRKWLMQPKQKCKFRQPTSSMIRTVETTW